MLQQLHIAGRNVDQRVPVAPASLDQHDAVIGVFSQPVGQTAASRAGANDDVVRLHVLCFP